MYTVNADELEKANMSQDTIEERVTRLEELVDQLLHPKPRSTQPGRDDWKRTFGMFTGDPVMKEIKTMHAKGHGVIGMKIIGNGMFKPREGQGYGPYPGYQTMWPYTPDYILGFLFVRNPHHIQQLIEQARRR